MVIVKASAFLLPFLFCSVDLWSSKKKQFTLYSNAFPYYSFISAVPLGGKTNLDYKKKLQVKRQNHRYALHVNLSISGKALLILAASL